MNREAAIELFGFVVAVFFIYWFVGYLDVLQEGPFGLHYIRQTDSLAFVDNYLLFDHGFWEPATYNLLSKNGNGASEFPIMYYITAQVSDLLGIDSILLKWVHLLVITLGVYALYRSCRLFQSVLMSFSITLLSISSTIFFYYAYNYLPDAPALGFIYIGNYFVLRGVKEKSTNYFLIISSFVFLTLASLIKAYFGIYLISGAVTLLYFGWRQKDATILRTSFAASTFGFLVTIAWVLYVSNFNKENQNDYFLTSILPIWNCTSNEIKTVLDYINNYWLNKVLYPSSRHVVIICLLCYAAIEVVLKRFTCITLWLGMTILGLLAFFILMFRQFQDHDYYFLVFLPLIPIVLMGTVISLQSIGFKIPAKVVPFVFIAIGLLALNYASEKLHKRYNDKYDDFSFVEKALQPIKPIIDKETELSEQIAIIGDPTRNGGLQVLHRKGWSINHANVQVFKQNFFEENQVDWIVVLNSELAENLLKKEELVLKAAKESVSLYQLKNEE